LGQQIELRIEVIDAPADRVVQTRTVTLPAQKSGHEQTAAEIAALVRQAISGS
jgi:hypothetical protein